jgi:hypothetical protein
MINISTVAVQARKALHSSGVNLSQTTALELMATLLGYGTYAALKLDRTVDPTAMFAEADHVVLQLSALPARMAKLGVDPGYAQFVVAAVVEACNEAVNDDDNPCRFHASMNDFQDFVFEDVQTRAVSDDEVSSAYAETNAYIDEFYTEDYEYDPLTEADDEWTMVASGSHTGEVDAERPYSGHAGTFTATYTFRKEGRCGLIEMDLDFSLGFDRDYDAE